jgi:hypothetical protein
LFAETLHQGNNYRKHKLSTDISRAIKPTLLLPLSIHFEPNYTREKDFANAFSEIDVIKIPEYLIKSREIDIQVHTFRQY